MSETAEMTSDEVVGGREWQDITSVPTLTPVQFLRAGTVYTGWFNPGCADPEYPYHGGGVALEVSEVAGAVLSGQSCCPAAAPPLPCDLQAINPGSKGQRRYADEP